MNRALICLALLAPLPALALPGIDLEAAAFGGAGRYSGSGDNPAGGNSVEYGVRGTVRLSAGPFVDAQFARIEPESDTFGDGQDRRIDELRIGGGYALSLPLLPVLTAGVYAHYISQDVRLGGADAGSSTGYDLGVLARVAPLPFFGAYARVGLIDTSGSGGYSADGLDGSLGADLSFLPLVRLFIEYRYTDARAAGGAFDSHGVRGGIRVGL